MFVFNIYTSNTTMVNPKGYPFGRLTNCSSVSCFNIVNGIVKLFPNKTECNLILQIVIFLQCLFLTNVFLFFEMDQMFSTFHHAALSSCMKGMSA